MRITGGTLRGRLLRSPVGQEIRPTADKTRLAIFNMLEARGLVRGAQVLDLCCGTGALGIESLSRGAEYAVFIDAMRSSLDLAHQNVRQFDLTSQTQFFLMNVQNLPLRSSGLVPASLVFLDPPYRKNLVLPTIQCLVAGQWLSTQGAVLVIEVEKEWQPEWSSDLTMLIHKTYGQTCIYVVQYNPQSS